MLPAAPPPSASKPASRSPPRRRAGRPGTRWPGRRCRSWPPAAGTASPSAVVTSTDTAIRCGPGGLVDRGADRAGEAAGVRRAASTAGGLPGRRPAGRTVPARARRRAGRRAGPPRRRAPGRGPARWPAGPPGRPGCRPARPAAPGRRPGSAASSAGPVGGATPVRSTSRRSAPTRVVGLVDLGPLPGGDQRPGQGAAADGEGEQQHRAGVRTPAGLPHPEHGGGPGPSVDEPLGEPGEPAGAAATPARRRPARPASARRPAAGRSRARPPAPASGEEYWRSCTQASTAKRDQGQVEAGPLDAGGPDRAGTGRPGRRRTCRRPAASGATMATRQPTAVARGRRPDQLVLPPAGSRSTDAAGGGRTAQRLAGEQRPEHGGRERPPGSPPGRPGRRTAGGRRRGRAAARSGRGGPRAAGRRPAPARTRRGPGSAAAGWPATERPTRSARLIRSISRSIVVTVCAGQPSPAASGTSATAAVSGPPHGGQPAASTAAEVGFDQPGRRRPSRGRWPTKSAGSSTNGPYEVPETGAARADARGRAASTGRPGRGAARCRRAPPRCAVRWPGRASGPGRRRSGRARRRPARAGVTWTRARPRRWARRRRSGRRGRAGRRGWPGSAKTGSFGRRGIRAEVAGQFPAGAVTGGGDADRGVRRARRRTRPGRPGPGWRTRPRPAHPSR